MDIKAVDEEYLRAGNWKCSLSPSHAHHWKEVGTSYHSGVFYCIHCYDCREFPITYRAIDAGFTSSDITWGFQGGIGRHE